MLKILAIDTALNACSAALQIGTTRIDRYELAPKRQSELIIPMVQSLLDEANMKLHQLDAIAFGCGPGSFTGVRLAASIAQGFCFSADIPAVPISTLQALAQRAYREYQVKNVLVAQDARIQEIYWAAYMLDDSGIMRSAVADRVSKADTVKFAGFDINLDWFCVGDAWEVYEKILPKQSIGNAALVSQAQDIASLAIFAYQKKLVISAEEILPVYLQEDIFKTNPT